MAKLKERILTRSVMSTVVCLFFSQTPTGLPLGTMKLELTTLGPIKAEIHLNEGILRGDLGKTLIKEPPKSSYWTGVKGHWQWPDGKQLLIDTHNEYESCKTVVWLNTYQNDHLQDCFDIEPGTYWYGGSDGEASIWPLIFAERPERPEITGWGTGESNLFHNRYWVNSKGVVIKVDDNIPLFTSVKENKLCFIARRQYPYFENPTEEILKLSYAICYGYNPRDVLIDTLDMFVKRPAAVPSRDFFHKPVWTTRPAISDKDLKTKTVVEYVTKINSLQNSDSYLRIVGNWEACTGSLAFHSGKFANPTEMLSTLTKFNMTTIVQLLPFYEEKCKDYADKADKSYFVSDLNGDVLQTNWTNGTYAMIDFTNDETSQSWKSDVIKFTEYFGVSSFFFDEGQASQLPKNYSFPERVDKELLPDIYTTKYIEAASGLGNPGIVSVGRLSQSYPFFAQMKPLQHDTWDGLREVIPRALRLGIMGFPFILPDVAGGSLGTKTKPETNLYIRWLQVNALMPSLHFSLGPWEFTDINIPSIINQTMALRRRYLLLLTTLADAAVIDGQPIIRPLWWIAPLDEEALKCNDQFMIGNDIIVAPVVKDSESRDIYLPPGEWCDVIKGGCQTGGKTLTDYYANISTLPVFERKVNPTLLI